ncbi:unnamed protein product [Penicillium salamii]|nr:unnamed protein product [Penicillium salamii]
MGSSSLLIVPWLVESVHAFTTFNTNCTLPPSSATVSYVSSPNTRGTMSIVWSCLFTVIACTWTVQHPDLPHQRWEYPKTNAGWWRWSIKKWTNLSAWFLGTIIAPEVLLAKYVADLQEANEFFKNVEKFAKDDRVEWTRTHCMFAVMGGFVMKTNGSQSERPNQEANKPAGTKEAGALADAATKSPPGSSIDNTISSKPPEPKPLSSPSNDDKQEAPQNQQDLESGASSPEWKILYPTDIIALRKSERSGTLEKLPDISAAYINDKSKSDNLMRLIAILQIIWLCIQVIARAVGGLAVSQLEISTVAFAFCAIIMYALCWDKPKNVEIPIIIFEPSDGGAQARIITDSEECAKGRRRRLFQRMEDAATKFDDSGTMQKIRLTLYDAMMLSGVLFGGVHVIAWNFAFPTHVELILWRVATLHCTCYPASMALLYRSLALIALYQNKKNPRENTPDSEPTESFNPVPQESDSAKSDHGQSKNGEISAPLPSESPENEEPLTNEATSDRKNTETSIIARIFWIALAIVVILTHLATSLCFIAYILARLFILVEMFRTLAFQPADVYIGTWAANFPNFS